MMNLYVVRSNGYYKIGITENFKDRLGQLQTSSPLKIEPVELYEFEDARLVERVLHQRFASQRTSGEWFSLSEGDLMDIVSVCLGLGGRHIPQPMRGEMPEWELINNRTRFARGYLAFTILFMSGLLALVMYGVSR